VDIGYAIGVQGRYMAALAALDRIEAQGNTLLWRCVKCGEVTAPEDGECDVCPSRAERAEAEVARLREALEEIVESHPAEDAMRDIARAALGEDT